MDEIIVFGMSLDVVWLPILIGIIIGLILPLRPFIRNKLYFTIRPNKEETLNKDVADLLHVSTKTLDNAMKKKYGVPFYTFWKNQRLDMVATQLEMEPELKLHDIATSFCFTDEFHLSKAFKQKFGISPQEYRNKTLL